MLMKLCSVQPDALPPELQGQDINPDDLPKIQGDNETAMERVIFLTTKMKYKEFLQYVKSDGYPEERMVAKLCKHFSLFILSNLLIFNQYYLRSVEIRNIFVIFGIISIC